MIASIQLRLVGGTRPGPDHNAAIGASVYQAFGEASPAAAKALHDDPRPSPYVLSELYPHRGADNLGFWFRIGCIDDALGRQMAAAVVAQAKLRIGTGDFVVEGLSDVSIGPLEGPRAFHTLSPILLRDKDTKYCHISEATPGEHDPVYGERLEAAMNHALARERPEAGQVEVGATTVGKPRKRSLHGRTVFAQTAKFYVDGSPEALGHIASRGIGWSRTHGFGFVAPDRE